MSSGIVNHDTSEINFSWSIAGVSITIGVVVVAFVFSVYLFKSTVSSELNAKDAQGMPHELSVTRVYEKNILNAFSWTNESKTELKVNIDIAKSLVVRDYNK
jgi:hypothetical protein